MAKIPTGNNRARIQGVPQVSGLEPNFGKKTEMALQQVRIEGEKTRVAIDNSLNAKDDIFELNTQSNMANTTSGIMNEYNNKGNFKNGGDYAKMINDAYDNIDYSEIEDPLRATKLKASMEVARQGALTKLQLSVKDKEFTALQGAAINDMETKKGAILNASSPWEAEAAMNGFKEEVTEYGSQNLFTDEALDSLGDFMNDYRMEAFKYAIDSDNLPKALEIAEMYKHQFKARGQSKEVRDILEKELKLKKKEDDLEKGNNQKAAGNEMLASMLSGDIPTDLQIKTAEFGGVINDSIKSDLLSISKTLRTGTYGSGDDRTWYELNRQINALKNQEKIGEDKGGLTPEQINKESDRLYNLVASNKTMDKGQYRGLLGKLSGVGLEEEEGGLAKEKRSFVDKLSKALQRSIKTQLVTNPNTIFLSRAIQLAEQSILAAKTPDEAETAYAKGKLNVAKTIYPELDNAKEVPQGIYDGEVGISTGSVAVAQDPDKNVTAEGMIRVKIGGVSGSMSQEEYDSLSQTDKAQVEVL